MTSEDEGTEKQVQQINQADSLDVDEEVSDDLKEDNPVYQQN